MKWSQALKDYQSYLRIERGLSQNTIASYSLDIKKLMQWLEENSIRESPEKITEKTLQEFIYQVAKSMTPRTQSRIISGLRGFFNYLIFEEYMQGKTDLISGCFITGYKDICNSL